VETFDQLLKVVREETGLLAMDGFFFLFKNQTMEDSRNSNENMIHLLRDTKNIRFIMNYFDGGKSLNQFVVKKSGHDTLIPYSYCGIAYLDGGWQVFSQCVTKFNRELEPRSTAINFPIGDDKYYGDKALFDELKQDYLGPKAKYFPIERDGKLTMDSMDEAVRSNNIPLLLECFANDMNLDYRNLEDKSLLCLSIELNNKEMFKLLLENGANPHLWNHRGEALIHIAAMYDREGYFMKRLIEKKVDIFRDTYSTKKNPLDLAIDANNVTAVGCLLEAGAIPSRENKKALEQPLFASVYTPPPPEEDRPTLLGQVVDLIKKGDCVVLHDEGLSGIMYNTHAPHPNQELHIIDVHHPFGSVLAEGEWPDFIAMAGYQGLPYDKEAFVNLKFAQLHEWALVS
jgi:hypothetical protein